jgi:hypothetical protein
MRLNVAQWNHHSVYSVLREQGTIVTYIIDNTPKSFNI